MRRFSLGCLALAVLTPALPRHVARWMLVALLAYQLWDTSLWVYYNLSWGPAVGQRLYSALEAGGSLRGEAAFFSASMV